MRNRAAAFSILTCFCLLSASAIAQPRLHKSIQGAKRIVFLGDSITDAGHYIAMLDAQLKTQLPTEKIELINLGLPSEGCTGLSEPDHPFPRPNVHERLDRVLAKTKPDVIVACYGMNDGIYYPLSKERFEKYQQGMKALIKKVKGANARLVILTPPAFDPQPFKKRGKLLPKGAEKYAWFAIYEGYADVIKAYADWVGTLGKAVDQVIDIHTPVVEFLAAQRKKNPAFETSSDGVHMNAQGHSVLAKTIAKAWGLDPELDPDPKLLAVLEKQHKILHAAWLSEVGHKRPGVKPGLPLKEAQRKAKELGEK